MASRDLTIIGDKALLKKFKRLGVSVQKRVVRRPLTAALSPIVKAAKREAPKVSKALSKSIGKKVRTYKGAVWGAVGPRTDERYTVEYEGRPRVPANYAHLVEFGTLHSAPKPFLRRALDENRTRVMRIQSEGIKKNILKEAAKK